MESLEAAERFASKCHTQRFRQVDPQLMDLPWLQQLARLAIETSSVARVLSWAIAFWETMLDNVRICKMC